MKLRGGLVQEVKSCSMRPADCIHVPLLAPRFLIEKDAVGHRVIKGHEGANKLTLVDSERSRPNQITIGRNTTSPGLKPGNEGIVLGTHPSG